MIILVAAGLLRRPRSNSADRLPPALTEYHEWLTTFLRSVELPIVFYCAPELSAYVKGLRGNKVSLRRSPSLRRS